VINNSKLDAITDDIYTMLNSMGLQRVNPIFEDKPTTELHGNKDFTILFKRDLYLRHSNIGPQKDLENWVPTIMWWIVEGLTFRQESRPFKKISSHGTKYSEYGIGGNHQKLQLILRKNLPIYIDCVIRVVRKYSPKSMIFIFDGLPGDLRINGFHYKLEDDKEGILRTIATDMGHGGGTIKFKNALNNIISNKELRFKEAIDKVLRLRGFVVQGDFSYCLTCGEAIEKVNARSKPNLYCITEPRIDRNNRMPNPNNCRNVFNRRQELRLELKTPEERTEHGLKLYKELQKMIRTMPLHAFDELVENHPELYTDRRKTAKAEK